MYMQAFSTLHEAKGCLIVPRCHPVLGSLMHSIRTVRQHIEQLQVMVPVLQAAEAALSSRVDFN